MAWRITRKSRRDAFTNRTLLKRLALKVAKDKDRHAAEVLGDLMMENQLSVVQTGRKRQVVFRTFLNHEDYDAHFGKLLRSGRLRRTGRLSAEPWRGVEDPVFTLYGQETLSGIPEYAARRTGGAWREIRVSWPVSKKDLYRKLKAMRLLPPSFRLSDLWIKQADNLGQVEDGDVEYEIHKNRKTKKDLMRIQRRTMESALA